MQELKSIKDRAIERTFALIITFPIAASQTAKKVYEVSIDQLNPTDSDDKTLKVHRININVDVSVGGADTFDCKAGDGTDTLNCGQLVEADGTRETGVSTVLTLSGAEVLTVDYTSSATIVSTEGKITLICEWENSNT